MRLILKEKSGKKHCLLISCFSPVGLDIFENDGTSEKGYVEIEDWGFCTLWIRVSRKLHLHLLYTYVLATLKNGARFSYTKADFKN